LAHPKKFWRGAPYVARWMYQLDVRKLQYMVEFIKMRHRSKVCYLWLPCYSSLFCATFKQYQKISM